MKATKLSVIFLYILISGYADREKPVSATKQGKAPPKVPPSQSTVSPAGQVGPTQGSQAGQKAVPGSKANKPGAGNEGTQQPNLPVQSTVSPAGQVGPTQGSLPGQNAPSKNNPAGLTVPGSKANKPGPGNEGTQQPNLPVQSTVSPAGQVGPTQGSLPGQNAPSENNPAGLTVPGSKANKPGPGNEGTQQPNLPVQSTVSPAGQVGPTQGSLPGQNAPSEIIQQSTVSPAGQVGPTQGSLPGQNAPSKNNPAGLTVPGSKANKPGPGNEGTQQPNLPGNVPSQSATTKPPLSNQVTSPSATKKKGKSYQVTPKPPTNEKPQSQVPKKTPLSTTQSVNTPLPSQVANKGGPSAKLPMPTPTPTGVSTGVNFATPAPSATQSAINKVTSSPVGVAPASSVAPPDPATTNTATTPALPTSAPAAPFSREENIALTEHNFYRAMHKSNPIELNKDLVLEARQYAKKLSVRGTLARETSKIGQGESLGMVWRSVPL
ncbi:hypothetical protein OS493_005249 [Desmophyllum pertusum]|uniref:SCP domain-containing protein n=1 Tax=Desmophyllum pertusum TaxID=174260 RepID=A0A9X0CTF1_9CNID|nr:hypothetical protein OS493_005249 [Desmophyllum pertusum]